MSWSDLDPDFSKNIGSGHVIYQKVGLDKVISNSHIQNDPKIKFKVQIIIEYSISNILNFRHF